MLEHFNIIYSKLNVLDEQYKAFYSLTMTQTQYYTQIDNIIYSYIILFEFSVVSYIIYSNLYIKKTFLKVLKTNVFNIL